MVPPLEVCCGDVEKPINISTHKLGVADLFLLVRTHPEELHALKTEKCAIGDFKMHSMVPNHYEKSFGIDS